MSDKKGVIQVAWDGALQISKGDEIEIIKGIALGENYIRASVLKNITLGREERSRIEGVLMTKMPEDIRPPRKGVVQQVHATAGQTYFELIEGVGVLEIGLGKLIKEANVFLDKEIIDKCIGKKDAEDILTSAFRILEERIRAKIGATPEICGLDLINAAFKPKTGKLIFGKTAAEQEGLFHLYRGSILFFRNPPSHRFVTEFSEFETFAIVILVNLLLNILEKCQPRIP